MAIVGYAPGAWDLCHIGHLNVLRHAREHCDRLVAGVVSDEMLLEAKGRRPVVPLAERLEIVRSIRFVDAYERAVADISAAVASLAAQLPRGLRTRQAGGRR